MEENTEAHAENPRLIVRRLAAFFIDYLIVVLPYIILLTLANILISDIDTLTNTPIDPIRGQLLGFFTLTLPVTLYFALTEGWRGATPGKQIAGLSIETTRGHPPGFPASILRNVLKFLPWEIAHWGLWRVWTQETFEFSYLMSFIIAYALIGIYFVSMLFSASRQTLYDRLLALRIIRRK